MPTITLTITDTQERVLTALEQIDTLTVDERFAPYLRDIVRNRAGIDTDRDPDVVEAGVAALEHEALAVLTGVQAASLPEAPAEAPSEPEPVQELVEEPAVVVIPEPDAPLPLFELTPPEPTEPNPEPATQEI